MSIFGSQPAAPQPTFGSAPSLFGAPAQSSASLFGGQSTPSLFGGAPAQSSTALFGAPAQSSTSLFGAPAQSTPLFGAPAQSSSSLFGAPAQSTSLFGAPQQSSASLFGAAPQSSTSLFGAPAQSSSSLFGAPAQGTSLFGAPPQPAGSVFGGGNQQQAGGLWNNAQQQQQNVQPVEITGLTRISHLPQNFQTDMFAVERHLRDQRTKASKLWSKRSNFDTDVVQIRSRSADVSRRLVKLRALLESLKANSDTLKTAVRTERASAEPVVIALENITKNNRSTQVGFLSSSNGLRYSGHEVRMQDRSTHVPEEYFMRVVGDLESRAYEYKGEIDEIADFLRAQGVVLSSTSGSLPSSYGLRRAAGTTPLSLLDGISQRHHDMGIHEQEDLVASRGRTIEEIIRRQYEYFMVVGGHIAGVSENLQSTREHFLRLIHSRDPDVLNPFQQADLREKAEKERQRILADKRALDGAMLMGGTAFPPSQGTQLQSQSQPATTVGAATGFGATPGTNVQSNSLFAGATGFGANESNGSSQARRVSGGRRKRV